MVCIIKITNRFIYLVGIISVFTSSCIHHKRIHGRHFYSRAPIKTETTYSEAESPPTSEFKNNTKATIESGSDDFLTDAILTNASDTTYVEQKHNSITLIDVITNTINPGKHQDKKVESASVSGFQSGIVSFILLTIHYQHFWVAGKGSVGSFRLSASVIAFMALFGAILCILSVVRISRNPAIYKHKWIAIAGLVISAVAFCIALVLALTFL